MKYHLLGLTACVCALTWGCTFDSHGANGDDDGGDVDIDGGPDGDLVDAGADAPPVDAACESRCVSEDELETCAPGGGTQLVGCPLGCFAAEDRCRRLVPSNGAGEEDLGGVTAGLDVPALSTVVVDTDTGEIRNGLVVLRAAGTGVVDGIQFRKPATGPAVLALADLEVAATGTLRPSGSRALVILARGDITVRGVVDASAGCESPGLGQPDYRCGGPGGGNGSGDEGPSIGCASGGNGTSSATLPETGGGGGGFGQDGASGGSIATTKGGLGGLVGPSCGSSTLVPLFGGSGGGQGGGDGNLLGGEGGGGGGGLQLTSMTHILVEKSGTNLAAVVAQGGGGKGGGPSLGGGGGGSGGGILLEAPVVTLTGAIVAANGGSGGQGNGFENGVPGNPSAMRAEGAGEGDGRGGDGGAKSNPAEAGFGSVNVAFDGSGGGGGGAGRVRVNAEELESTSGTVISPAESVGSPARE